MALRRYAAFSTANSGTGLEIEQGGRVITTELSSLDINRISRATVGVTEDTHYAEFTIYGEAESITNLVSIGVCTAATGLTSSYVGGDVESTSVGYRVAEGEIHVGGASVASVTAGANGDTVSIRLDFALATPSIAFFLNGVLLHSMAIPDGSPTLMLGEEIYLAVSVGSTTAGDILVFANTGRVDFVYESLSVTSLGGWWAYDVLEEPLRISTKEYLSGSDEDPPNTRWRGWITSAAGSKIEEVVFWPWSDTTPRASLFSITVSDPDGQLDYLIGGSWRDEEVEILSVDDGAALSTAVPFGTYVFDSCEVISDGEKRLVFRDDRVLLERPLQTRFFLPTADSDVAFRPYPTTVGVGYNIEPVAYKILDLLYALDSKGIQNIGKVRDSGDPLDSTASPADYTVLQSGQVIQLRNDPFGVVTTDVSVTGSSYVPDEGDPPPDALSGIGDPFAGTPGSTPTGWTGTANGADWAPRLTASSGRVAFQQKSAGNNPYIQATGVTLTAGQPYLFQYTIHTASVADPNLLGPRVYVCQSSNIFTEIGTSVPINADTTFPITVTFTHTPVVNHSVFMHYHAGNLIGTDGVHDCEVGEFTIVEIPVVDPTESDNAVEEALAVDSLSLEGILRQLIEVRSGLPASYWSSADAAAIDTATGYTGSGYHSREQVQRRVPIDWVVQSYGAAIHKDSSGVLRITRMIAPEDYVDGSPDTLSYIYEYQMLSDLVPIIDDAPNLTTQLSLRKNWRKLSETEVVSDDVDVPLSLRRKMGRDYRHTVSSGTQLAAGLDHALGNDPLETLLNLLADGQAEINRICAIYAYSRCFYDVTLPLDIAPEVGAICVVTYSRYGLNNGVQLMCVRVESDPIGRESKVRFWGLAPSELI